MDLSNIILLFLLGSAFTSDNGLGILNKDNKLWFLILILLLLGNDRCCDGTDLFRHNKFNNFNRFNNGCGCQPRCFF